MNRIERDKQRSRMKKQIDDIIRNNPEYFVELAKEMKKEIGIDFIELWKKQEE